MKKIISQASDPEGMKRLRDAWNERVREDEAEAQKAYEVAIATIEKAREAAHQAGKGSEWWISFLLNVDDHSDGERFAACAEAALLEVID